MHSRWLRCVASALAVAGVAWADPLPDHRSSLRANLGLVTAASDPLPGDAFLAVSFSRRFSSRFGVDAFLGPGLPVTTLAKDGSGGEREVDLSSDLHAAALLRFEHPLTASGRWVFSLSAGPSFAFGGVYGTVPMARAEGGFDWRFAKSKLISLSIGYESVLSTSPKPFEASDCLHASPSCPPYYKKGSGQVSARWAFGFTF